MSEVTVVCLFKAKPECLDDLVAAMTTMAEQTHANDEGCLLYSLQQGLDDPCDLSIVEKWTSREALDAHGQKPHITDGAAARRAMMAQPAQIIFMRQTGAGTPEQGLL